MDRDKVEVHKLAKKERGQYPAILTEQTWSIKDLFYGFRGNFACGIQRVVPSGQDASILPARVANHSARFGSSCPLAEVAIYGFVNLRVIFHSQNEVFLSLQRSFQLLAEIKGCFQISQLLGL